MENFESAFAEFKLTGYFNLINASLSLSQIHKLNEYIRQRPKKTLCKIALTNLNLTLETEKKSSIKSSNSDSDEVLIPGIHYLTGPITAEEHAFCVPDGALADIILNHLSNSFLYTTPSRTKQYGRSQLEIQRIMQLQDKELTPLEKALLDLLSLPNIWSSISVDNLCVCLADKTYLLSKDFETNLLENLALYSNLNLKEFCFKLGTELRKNELTRLLTKFLEQCCELERISLITINENIFPSLIPIIMQHPSLKSIKNNLALETTYHYYEILQSLDKNYRIESIDIPTPTGEELQKIHQALQQRLSTSSLDRFKREKTSQETLTKLAIQALKEDNTALFITLLRQSSNTTAISLGTWRLEAHQLLPQVYRDHPAHTSECAEFFKLNLNIIYKKKENDTTLQTLGYYLLEKAFSLKNTSSFICLLESNANILEKNRAKTNLLQKILEDKNPIWRKEIIKHLSKELKILIPAAEFLVPITDVYAGLSELMKHNKDYLLKLNKELDLYKIFSMLRFINSILEDRKKEWVLNLELLTSAIADNIKKIEISYSDLSALQEGLKHITNQADIAKRGFLGRSNLHDGSTTLIKKIDTAINKHKEKMYDKSIDLVDKLQEQLEAQRDATEKQVQKTQCDEKIDAKSKAEIRTEIRAEMEAEMEGKVNAEVQKQVKEILKNLSINLEPESPTSHQENQKGFFKFK